MYYSKILICIKIDTDKVIGAGLQRQRHSAHPHSHSHSQNNELLLEASEYIQRKIICDKANTKALYGPTYEGKTNTEQCHTLPALLLILMFVNNLQ